MKNLSGLLTLTLLPFLLGACSTQYRTAPEADFADIQASLSEVTSAGASDSTLSQFQQLAQTSGANIYYADSAGSYGPVDSVASLGSFAFMGLPGVWVDQIQEVRVFFVDAWTAQGRQAGLLVALKTQGSSSFTVKAFVSSRPSEVDAGEYVAVLASGGTEALTLRTMYVDENDELEGVVRMDVSEFDGQGYETYIGQFSTLVGYQIY
jgi:hypothetical protein